jgi:Ca-activated chloride channel homolog
VSSRNRSSFLIAAVLAITMPQKPNARAQKANPKTIRVETSLVLVEATVKDKAGLTVDGLAKSDFQITADGSPQTISHFSRDQLPLAVALVVDLSTSISPYLDQLRYSMQNSLLTLKAEDEVALFTFTYDVKKRADLTQNKSAVANQFENLPIGGSTNINDALYEAAHYLRERASAARRVIILVSDNVASQEGKFAPDEVEKEILRADAVVYSLKIPGETTIGEQKYIEIAGPALVNVSKIVPHTGGEIFEVQKEGSLTAAFAALIQRLKARYTLGFMPEQPAGDGRFHLLDVRLVSGRCKGCTVYTKRSYFAAPAPSSSR